jgi:hypothetical protein
MSVGMWYCWVTHFLSSAYHNGHANSWFADSGAGLEMWVKLKYCSTSRCVQLNRGGPPTCLLSKMLTAIWNKGLQITVTQCFAFERNIGMTFDKKSGYEWWKINVQRTVTQNSKGRTQLGKHWRRCENYTKWILKK